MARAVHRGSPVRLNDSRRMLLSLPLPNVRGLLIAKSSRYARSYNDVNGCNQASHSRKQHMSEARPTGELLALTTEIVSAYFANNRVEAGDVAALVKTVFDKLSALGSEEAAPTELTPAVPIKKSVTDDYIVCLEDGKKLKMLKRHLMTAYGMTPEQYRAKWGLKPDYPMVAPNYALKRQELAKKIGLGRKPRSSSRLRSQRRRQSAAAPKPRRLNGAVTLSRVAAPPR